MYDRCSCILALLLLLLREIRGSTADGRCSALVPQGCFLLGHSFLQSGLGARLPRHLVPRRTRPIQDFQVWLLRMTEVGKRWRRRRVTLSVRRRGPPIHRPFHGDGKSPRQFMQGAVSGRATSAHSLVSLDRQHRASTLPTPVMSLPRLSRAPMPSGSVVTGRGDNV
jgi:hypothetical protein